MTPQEAFTEFLPEAKRAVLNHGSNPAYKSWWECRYSDSLKQFNPKSTAYQERKALWHRIWKQHKEELCGIEYQRPNCSHSEIEAVLKRYEAIGQYRSILPILKGYKLHGKDIDIQRLKEQIAENERKHFAGTDQAIPVFNDPGRYKSPGEVLAKLKCFDPKMPINIEDFTSLEEIQAFYEYWKSYLDAINTQGYTALEDSGPKLYDLSKFFCLLRERAREIHKPKVYKPGRHEAMERHFHAYVIAMNPQLLHQYDQYLRFQRMQKEKKSKGQKLARLVAMRRQNPQSLFPEIEIQALIRSYLRQA